ASKGTKRSKNDIAKDLNDFFGLRVKNWLSENGHKYDVIDAVMGAGFSDLLLTKNRAELITAELAERKTSFKSNVEAFNRVCNLAAKAEHDAVDPTLFVEQVETDLYKTWSSVHEQMTMAIAERNI